MYKIFSRLYTKEIAFLQAYIIMIISKDIGGHILPAQNMVCENIHRTIVLPLSNGIAIPPAQSFLVSHPFIHSSLYNHDNFLQWRK